MKSEPYLLKNAGVTPAFFLSHDSSLCVTLEPWPNSHVGLWNAPPGFSLPAIDTSSRLSVMEVRWMICPIGAILTPFQCIARPC
jgi:hypothetical protein